VAHLNLRLVGGPDGKYKYQTVKKWLPKKSRTSILADDLRGKLGLYRRGSKAGGASRSRKAKHPEVEADVHLAYRARRDKGRRVSALWLRKTYENALRRRVGPLVFKSSAERVRLSKVTRGWLLKFLSRHRICRRKRCNVKSTATSARVPGIKLWHAGVKALVRDEEGRRPDPTVAVDPVEGRFPFKLRLNFDEVPLAFIPGMDYTYEDKGATSVQIRQPGSGALSKRMGTLVVLVSGDGVLLRPAMIFRGTGERISAEERAAYSPDVFVMFQPKAWMDNPAMMVYARGVLEPVLTQRGLVPGVKDQEGLLFLDNLAAHRCPEFKDYVKKRGVLCWYHSPGDTDIEQVVDAGNLGALIKRHYDVEQEAWLNDDKNLAQWEDNTLTASARRILVTHWVAAACRKIKGSTVTKGFLRTGCLMSADATNDAEVAIKEVPNYEFMSAMSQLPAPGVASGPAPAAAMDDAAASGESDEDSEGVPDAASDEESEGNSDGGQDFDMDTLDSCVPAAMRVVMTAPAAVDVALLGRFIVYKWNTGWARGVLHTHYAPARGRNRFNFEVDYPFEQDGQDRRDHCLGAAKYSGAEDAAVGSWALLETRPK
jgi:hypothetical protein